MKKIMAVLGCVAVLALGACAPRAARSGLTDRGGNTQQQQPAANQPGAAAPAGNDPAAQLSSTDTDLAGVDADLNGIDSDLSAAAAAPDDAD
jgi:hypothetical protein